ncbi:class I lanthipeptide [Flavobacterium amniphilum]|uniref:class I lanthipeptide n=1 Tax=Flavobacterium amniphilum TaxID=1834035 RepID=UPI002029D8A4|nr:class I lanthipeptide [Flavobacterium amniphilum]MCL9807410.1 class I lanthipeptide [Flavobacterium amniphilum]
MKKQNVNNKLAFNKAAVTELNENVLAEINGGASINDLIDAIGDAIKDAVSQMTRPIIR